MDMLKKVKYIIIDEISMMVEMFYQLFIMIKKIYPDIKFIISGDFAQLPPVNDNWSGDYKNSPAMFELCEGNRIQLIKCRRADDKLFKLCKDVDSVNTNMFPRIEKTYLYEMGFSFIIISKASIFSSLFFLTILINVILSFTIYFEIFLFDVVYILFLLFFN